MNLSLGDRESKSASSSTFLGEVGFYSSFGESELPEILYSIYGSTVVYAYSSFYFYLGFLDLPPFLDS